jgi:hypothetical protein
MQQAFTNCLFAFAGRYLARPKIKAAQIFVLSDLYEILFLTFQRALRFLLPILRRLLDLAMPFSTFILLFSFL